MDVWLPNEIDLFFAQACSQPSTLTSFGLFSRRTTTRCRPVTNTKPSKILLRSCGRAEWLLFYGAVAAVYGQAVSLRSRAHDHHAHTQNCWC